MRHFREQLQGLFETLLAMGALVEEMILTALRVLTERDEELAGQVFATERRVNELQVEVDDTAVKLTALQQPVAGDVRFLFMASRIGGELERIGDQAVNICQNARYVLAGTPLPEMSGLAAMAESAERMVRQSVTAMRMRDVELAARVIGADQEVDDRRDQVIRLLVNRMAAEPSTTTPATSLVLIAHNLERVADHATNVGEEVIYWIQGRDVRHLPGSPAAQTGAHRP